MRKAVAEFSARYDAYFERENARVDNAKSKLDSAPRVVLVPGVGLFGVGRTAKDAVDRRRSRREHRARRHRAEAIGRYEPLPESDLFALEYWSLEQAKLKGAVVEASDRADGVGDRRGRDRRGDGQGAWRRKARRWRCVDIDGETGRRRSAARSRGWGSLAT